MLGFDWFRKIWSLVFIPKVIDKKAGVKFWYKGVKIKIIAYDNKGCKGCYFYDKKQGIPEGCRNVECGSRKYIKC